MLGRLLAGLSWVNFLCVLVRCSRSLFQSIEDFIMIH